MKKKIVLILILLMFSGSVLNARMVTSDNTKEIRGPIAMINVEKGFVQVNETVLKIQKDSPVISLLNDLKIGDYVAAYYKKQGNLKILLDIKKIAKDECGGPK